MSWLNWKKKEKGPDIVFISRILSYLDIKYTDLSYFRHRIIIQGLLYILSNYCDFGCNFTFKNKMIYSDELSNAIEIIINDGEETYNADIFSIENGYSDNINFIVSNFKTLYDTIKIKEYITTFSLYVYGTKVIKMSMDDAFIEAIKVSHNIKNINSIYQTSICKELNTFIIKDFKTFEGVINGK